MRCVVCVKALSIVGNITILCNLCVMAQGIMGNGKILSTLYLIMRLCSEEMHKAQNQWDEKD